MVCDPDGLVLFVAEKAALELARHRHPGTTLFGPHIGGVMPSRPTEMAAASSVPSSFLAAPGMKILARKCSNNPCPMPSHSISLNLAPAGVGVNALFPNSRPRGPHTSLRRG